jgi:hypothetical protein
MVQSISISSLIVFTHSIASVHTRTRDGNRPAVEPFDREAHWHRLPAKPKVMASLHVYQCKPNAIRKCLKRGRRRLICYRGFRGFRGFRVAVESTASQSLKQLLAPSHESLATTLSYSSFRRYAVGAINIAARPSIVTAAV